MNTNEVPHRLMIARSEDRRGVYMCTNDRTTYFDNEMWDEFIRMARDFNATGASKLMNYTEHLPVRTPIHDNTPLKPTLEDLA